MNPRRAVAILDCKRDPTYVYALYDSADFFGSWDGPGAVVWSGDGSPDIQPPAAFEVIQRPRAGTLPALLSAMRWAIGVRADSLLVLENDVIFDAGALELIRDYEIPPDLPFVSFFQSPTRGIVGGPGLVRVHFVRPEKGSSPRYSFLQAVLFSRAAIDEFEGSHIVAHWARGAAYADRAVGRALFPRWQEFGVHLPYPVAHIGAHSSYGWDSSEHCRREGVDHA